MSARSHNIGRILLYIVAALLGLSAVGKLVGPEALINNFERWHLLPYRHFIAILEIGAVSLLILPRTWVWGLLACSGYLGGAIVTHMTAGEPFLVGATGPGSIVPCVFLAVLWLGAWLRRPSLFEV